MYACMCVHIYKYINKEQAHIQRLHVKNLDTGTFMNFYSMGGQ